MGQQGRDSIPLSLTCCRYRRRPPTRQPPRRPSLLLPLAELPTARLTESYELKMSCGPLRGSEWGTRSLCLFSAERREAEVGEVNWGGGRLGFLVRRQRRPFRGVRRALELRRAGPERKAGGGGARCYAALVGRCGVCVSGCVWTQTGNPSRFPRNRRIVKVRKDL